MEGLPQNCELYEILGIALDIGPKVQHAHQLADSWKEGGDSGTCDACHGAELELCHRHQRTGIARRYDRVGIAVGNTGYGHPH